jgi:hypothetical protein
MARNRQSLPLSVHPNFPYCNARTGACEIFRSRLIFCVGLIGLFLVLCGKFEVVEGMQFDRGVTNADKMRIEAGTASAMPVASLGSNASNVETVALVCGPRGCVRTVPAYRRGVVVVRRPYVARGYYRRGYRRY